MIPDNMKYPRIDDVKSALFIQPHPDDNEIGAGGTIAYLRARGIPVYTITVTQGDGGGGDITPAEIAQIRVGEAEEAARILDQEYLGNLGYNNQNPGTVEEIALDLVKVIRQYRPDAIFSIDGQLENEIHPVHLKVAAAVDLAFQRAAQKSYPFESGVMHEDAFGPRILGRYFTDNDNTVVDVTPYYQLKMEAIKAHHSQVSPEFLGMLEQMYKIVSLETGFESAERLTLLYRVHTHCLAIPAPFKKYLRHN